MNNTFYLLSAGIVALVGVALYFAGRAESLQDQLEEANWLLETILTPEGHRLIAKALLEKIWRNEDPRWSKQHGLWLFKQHLQKSGGNYESVGTTAEQWSRTSETVITGEQ